MSQNLTKDSLSTLIPGPFARQYQIVPIQFDHDTLRVGMIDPNDSRCLGDLEFLTGKTIIPVQLTQDEVASLQRETYGDEAQVDTIKVVEQGEFQVIEKVQSSSDHEQKRSHEEWDDVSVISLVNQMITKAIDAGASDIHVEAYESFFRIRYRFDGVLQETMRPSVHQKQAIVARIKIMADLDIAEKRRPQDGRIRVKRGNRAIDIRVSTLPTDFGEKVVMRILDKSQLNLDLDQLGFDPPILSRYKKILALPYGMVLVTGPTGSGKTTTLYATLNHLNSAEVNIQTIEDPIEYNLDGINQSQVKSDIGYTFANAIRSFLRQDPDIIMVGEIRDQETAEIAVRSALTGHLVLSTLHTNNAPDTLTRLLDMGQEPFLISSSVKWVMAQRLLRKICSHCKTIDTRPETREKLAELDANVSLPAKLYMGKGCDQCGQTGYRGRTAIFEVLPISERIAEAINHRATARELRDLAREEGMETLQRAAFQKLAEGMTSVDEAVRETGF